MGRYIYIQYINLFFFFMISIILINYLDFGYSQTNNNNTHVANYGCAEYGPLFNCDPIPNMLESYALTANESQIYSVTRNDSFYSKAQLDSGLEMYDKYREYMEINNTNLYNTDTFSISFWLKGISDTNPYGHVVSHTNRANTAGWFFDLKTIENNNSSTDQFLRFVLTNSSDGI